MAKAVKGKGKPKRTMKQIADAMYKTPPASRDPARAAQVASRARGATSPLGGMALGGLFGGLAGLGRAAAKKGSGR
jgi:hypothetical protein